LATALKMSYLVKLIFTVKALSKLTFHCAAAPRVFEQLRNFSKINKIISRGVLFNEEMSGERHASCLRALKT